MAWCLNVKNKKNYEVVCSIEGLKKENNKWIGTGVIDLLVRYLLKVGATTTDAVLPALFGEHRFLPLCRRFAILLAWGIKFNNYEKLKKLMYKIAERDGQKRFLVRVDRILKPHYLARFDSLATDSYSYKTPPEDKQKFKELANINCYGPCCLSHEQQEARKQGLKKRAALIDRYTYNKKGDFREIPQEVLNNLFEDILKRICVKLYDEKQMKPLDPNFLRFVKKNIDQEELTDKLKQNLESRLKVSN